MTTTDILAYIGAAAWLYPVGILLWHIFIKPKVTIYPDKYAQIGFTGYGPIFNIRFATRALRKNAFIDNILITITHEKGNTSTFECNGLDEIYSQIVAQDGQKQSVGKSFSPIVLFLKKDSINDAFFKFQEKNFFEDEATYAAELAKADRTLKMNSHYNFDIFLESEEMKNYMQFLKRKFFWLAGKYSITFQVFSDEKITLLNEKYSFSLSQDDIDLLQSNIEKVKDIVYSIWLIDNPRPEITPPSPQWNWRYVRVMKES